MDHCDTSFLIMENTVSFHWHFITTFVIPFDPGVVFVGNFAIRLMLPMSPISVPVGYKGHIKQHAPSKNSCAWEGLEHCVIDRVTGRCRMSEKICDATLADSFCHVIFSYVAHPHDCLMHAFKDCICLWVLDTGRLTFDPKCIT